MTSTATHRLAALATALADRRNSITGAIKRAYLTEPSCKRAFKQDLHSLLQGGDPTRSVPVGNQLADLRKALSYHGLWAPESDEALALEYDRHAGRLVRAVALKFEDA